MRTYVVRRLWQSALTLVGVSVLVFVILRVVPGDPAKMLLPEGVTVTHVHPEPPGEPPETVSVVLMPGATFPALRIELLNTRGQRRLVRIDPLAAVPVVEIP
jgi:hypothetical protein